jgi:hypothetical protein
MDLRFGGLSIADCCLGLLGLGLVFFGLLFWWVASCCLDLGLWINKLGYCLVELDLLSNKIWWACYSFIKFYNF